MSCASYFLGGNCPAILLQIFPSTRRITQCIRCGGEVAVSFRSPYVCSNYGRSHAGRANTGMQRRLAPFHLELNTPVKHSFKML